MSNMDKKSLSATDICRIIKQCQGTGIARIAIGELVIDFNPRRNGEPDVPIQNFSAEPFAVSEISSSATELAGLMGQELIEEANIAQLMIDDPLAYERLQMHQGIERERQLS